MADKSRISPNISLQANQNTQPVSTLPPQYAPFVCWRDPNDTSPDVRCRICWNIKNNSGTVTCSVCNTHVHASCYGSSDIPFTCDMCLFCSKVRIPLANIFCVLCYRPGGVQKYSNDGCWAHINCVLLSPVGPRFSNIRCRTAPIGISQAVMSHSRMQHSCSICTRRMGLTVPCSIPMCSLRVHVSCAYEAGHAPYFYTPPHEPENIVRVTYCRVHKGGDQAVRMMGQMMPNNRREMPNTAYPPLQQFYQQPPAHDQMRGIQHGASSNFRPNSGMRSFPPPQMNNVYNNAKPMLMRHMPLHPSRTAYNHNAYPKKAVYPVAKAVPTQIHPQSEMYGVRQTPALNKPAEFAPPANSAKSPHLASDAGSIPKLGWSRQPMMMDQMYAQHYMQWRAHPYPPVPTVPKVFEPWKTQRSPPEPQPVVSTVPSDNLRLNGSVTSSPDGKRSKSTKQSASVVKAPFDKRKSTVSERSKKGAQAKPKAGSIGVRSSRVRIEEEYVSGSALCTRGQRLSWQKLDPYMESLQTDTLKRVLDAYAYTHEQSIRAMCRFSWISKSSMALINQLIATIGTDGVRTFIVTPNRSEDSSNIHPPYMCTWRNNAITGMYPLCSSNIDELARRGEAAFSDGHSDDFLWQLYQDMLDPAICDTASSPNPVKSRTLDQSSWSEIMKLEKLLIDPISKSHSVERQRISQCYSNPAILKKICSPRQSSMITFFILLKKATSEITNAKGAANMDSVIVKFLSERENATDQLQPNLLRKTASTTKKIFLHGYLWDMNPITPLSDAGCRELLPPGSYTISESTILPTSSQWMSKEGEDSATYPSAGNIFISDETAREWLTCAQRVRSFRSQQLVGVAQSTEISRSDFFKAAKGEELVKLLASDDYWRSLLFSDDFIRRQAVWALMLWVKTRKRLNKTFQKINALVEADKSDTPTICNQRDMLTTVNKTANLAYRWSYFRKCMEDGHQDPDQAGVDKLLEVEPGKKERTLPLTGETPLDGSVERIYFCSVCFGPDSDTLNPISKCARCHVRVHKNCYALGSPGQLEIDQFVWLCERCQLDGPLSKGKSDNSKKPTSCAIVKCAICLRRAGAMQRLNFAESSCLVNSFVHISCAFWFGDVIVCQDLGRLRNFQIMISQAEATKLAASHACYYCNGANMSQESSIDDIIALDPVSTCTPDVELAKPEPNKPFGKLGLTVQCSIDGCQVHMHPLCAWLSGSQVSACTNYNSYTTCKNNTYLPDIGLEYVCARHSDLFEGRLPASVIEAHRTRAYHSHPILETEPEDLVNARTSIVALGVTSDSDSDAMKPSCSRRSHDQSDDDDFADPTLSDLTNTRKSANRRGNSRSSNKTLSTDRENNLGTEDYSMTAINLRPIQTSSDNTLTKITDTYLDNVCQVCLHEIDPGTQVLLCSKCSLVRIHKICNYLTLADGSQGTVIHDETGLCLTCHHGTQALCSACPRVGGAFILIHGVTTHTLCAPRSPGNLNSTYSTGNQRPPAYSKSQVCCFCGYSTGTMLNCSCNGCRFTMHMSCAKLGSCNSILCPVHREPRDPMRILASRATCLRGAFENVKQTLLVLETWLTGQYCSVDIRNRSEMLFKRTEAIRRSEISPLRALLDPPATARVLSCDETHSEPVKRRAKRIIDQVDPPSLGSKRKLRNRAWPS